MMNRQICVYAASSSQVNPIYIDAARQLGGSLAEADIAVLYGGGRVGLMGALADGVLERGGKIRGVIPQFMVDEGWDNPRVEEIVTPDMHERKSYMLRHSDAAVALPGGIGTLEELLEAITWHQLGLFHHPVYILNVDHFYDHLISMLHHLEDQRFMREGSHGSLYVVATSIDELMQMLQTDHDHVAPQRSAAQI